MKRIQQTLAFMRTHRVFFGIMMCVGFVVSSQIVYGFEDIGAKLQAIVKKAHNNGLKPMLEGSQLATLQKSMFDKKSNYEFTEAQIELGKILYFDPRLSKDGAHSCNSCHNISLQGTSPIDKSANNPYHLNTPTILNAIFNDAMYYKGEIKRHDKPELNTTPFLSKNIIARAVLHALSAKNEMNGDLNKIVQSISKSDEYMSYFIRAYGAKVKVDSALIAQSIAGFIMTLNTITRYDDFLNGNLKALSVSEAEGLELFIDRGCATCHSGVNLGGTMQPFEVIEQYKFANIGQFGSDSNKMLRVPTLRNVTASAPYFHNGGFTNLEDSIKEMGRIQLGINLSSKEIAKIIGFLEALRGDVKPITLPSLPRATF